MSKNWNNWSIVMMAVIFTCQYSATNAVGESSRGEDSRSERSYSDYSYVEQDEVEDEVECEDIVSDEDDIATPSVDKSAELLNSDMVDDIESIKKILSEGSSMDIYHVAEIEDQLKEELCDLIRARLTPIMLKQKDENNDYRVKSGAPDVFVNNPYLAQAVLFEDWYLRVFYCADKEIAGDAHGPLILPGFMLGGTPSVDSLIVFYKQQVGEDRTCAFIARGLNVHDVVIRTKTTWYGNIMRVRQESSLSRSMSDVSAVSIGTAYSARHRPPSGLRERRWRKRGGCFRAVPKLCLNMIDECDSSLRRDSPHYNFPESPSPKFSNCFNFNVKRLIFKKKD